ncbi:hypothetical protein [Pleionea sp. CnH1-48]|uniref:hypothetical protein n=1 Tax=Pleionea sp. CnH1-48 TaxID=2954494 RepID=UPI00209684D8|nr:hypothetical protein [Pleionea sp. CnH1-48]MCO7225064.1 hypothetical protein [Pleionea sp. CnH1-48]
MKLKTIAAFGLALASSLTHAENYLIDCEGFCSDDAKKKLIADNMLPSTAPLGEPQEHSVYFYDSQTERLTYYTKLVETSRVFGTSITQSRVDGPKLGTATQADAAKEMLEGTGGLFNYFGLDQPEFAARYNVLTGYTYRGALSTDIGFLDSHTLQRSLTYGESSWMAGLSDTFVTWLAGELNLSYGQVVAQLDFYSANRTGQMNAQMGVSVTVTSPTGMLEGTGSAQGSLSSSVQYGGHPAQIRMMLPDGALTLVWSSKLGRFELVEALDKNGHQLPLDKNGYPKSELVPSTLTISNANIDIWELLDKAFKGKVAHLSGAVKKFRSGNHNGSVTVREGDETPGEGNDNSGGEDSNVSAGFGNGGGNSYGSGGNVSVWVGGQCITGCQTENVTVKEN